MKITRNDYIFLKSLVEKSQQPNYVVDEDSEIEIKNLDIEIERMNKRIKQLKEEISSYSYNLYTLNKLKAKYLNNIHQKELFIEFAKDIVNKYDGNE